MIPVLFDGDETTFTTYGKGKLADAISCVIHETLSGEYDLEMEYPVTGRLFSEIAIGKTILASNGAYRRTASFQSNTPKIAQYFDIYKIGEEIDGIVKIYARHVIFRIGRSVIFAPSQDTSTYFKQWAQWIFENANPQISNFNLFTVGGYWPGGQAAYVVDDAFYVNIPTVDLPIAASPAIYLFGSGMLRDKCGVGVICSQFDIFIYSRRGGDYGASVRFGANMTNFNRDIDSTGKYNAVVPFWENEGVLVTGGLVQPSTPITPVSAVPLDLSNEFDEEPTAAQLETKAGDFLAENEPWNLIDTVEVDMATYNADTYQIIELGDDVRVYFDAFGINIKMRVIEYWYDVLGEEYQRLVIGTAQTEFVAVTGDTFAGPTGGGSGGGTDGYKPGDTLMLGASIVSNGLITSSTKVVLFMVVTPKSMAGITNVTATNLSAELRGTNGYLNSQSGFYDFADRSGYTVTCEKATDNMIRVRIEKSSAFSNVSNNTPITVNLDTTVAFEFS